MKKIFYIFITVITIFVKADEYFWGFDYGSDYQQILSISQNKNEDLNIRVVKFQNFQPTNEFENISKLELKKILDAGRNNKYISFENIKNHSFATVDSTNEKSLQGVESMFDMFNMQVNSGENEGKEIIALNTLYKDEDINLKHYCMNDAIGILYGRIESNGETFLYPVAYYDELGNTYDFAEQRYNSEWLRTSNNIAYENGENAEFNGENLNLLIIPEKENDSAILIPEIINFTSLIEETINKISVVVCACIGGFCCFLVIKKGLKWCRNYLGNTERQEKINNGWYEIEEGRFVPPVSGKIPSVVNDGGVWIDVLHDERYEGNNTIENYLEMRWANLYYKYQKESTRLAGKNIKVLKFQDFKALAERRNINVSTVDDESFTKLVVDNQLNGTLNLEEKPNRNYKRKYNPRKQYFAIRSYHKRKKYNQTV